MSGYFVELWVGIGIAAYAGLVIGRNIFQGGWEKRWTHRTCGWFEVHGFDLPGRREPCLGCGEVDDNWYWRLGRPIQFLPFGWQWKECNPTPQSATKIGRSADPEGWTRDENGVIVSVSPTWTGR